MSFFREGELTKMGAPMVRYSKLPFRRLILSHGADVAFSPMILADSFVSSSEARDNEFTSDPKEDHPLVVQFAANKVQDFVDASVLVAPYAEGVDLNCGCPQSWALKEGIGASLLQKPEFICDVVKSTKSVIPYPDFSVSVKIRLHRDKRRTIDLCKVENSGVDFITVHGRTKDQHSDPVDLEGVKMIKDALSIPVVANGDIKSLDDAYRVREVTGVDGVMAARGLLENPAMYAGFDITPAKCILDWLKISLEVGTPFQTFHHHLSYMLERSLSRNERKIFNALGSTASVLDYLNDNLRISL
uniref:tRNA-dihydrouridine synthase n=1 Tax=Lepeophtheirus salmonis TaxID=72036 RepID=C1BT40_LEPSM|nr:tRNA-dihydrouridine synthase 4-like [Lepeophtheirus salmonis]